MKTIKAIPTKIFGISFRSRLEARWAIFFHLLNYRWEYEPEGFFLGKNMEYNTDLMYLPDFLVLTPQNENIWFEIKPVTIKQDDKFDKFFELLHEPEDIPGIEEDDQYLYVRPRRAMLLSGQPTDILKKYNTCPRCGFFIDIQDTYYDYVYCMHCDCETPGGGGHEFEKHSFLDTRCRPHKGDIVSENSEDFPFTYTLTRDVAEYCRTYKFH